jgi:hypothetical protein
LSGQWEAKCWRLQQELHPRNCTSKRRVWRVNIEEDEVFPSSPVQVIEFFQGEITTHEGNNTNKRDNMLMLRASTI